MYNVIPKTLNQKPCHLCFGSQWILHFLANRLGYGLVCAYGFKDWKQLSFPNDTHSNLHWHVLVHHLVPFTINVVKVEIHTLRMFGIDNREPPPPIDFRCTYHMGRDLFCGSCIQFVSTIHTSNNHVMQVNYVCLLIKNKSSCYEDFNTLY